MPQAVGRSRPWRDHRQVVEGIVFRYRTGVAWRDLPGRFGPWQTVWKRHHRFATDGTWDKLLRVIQAEADAAGRVDWNVCRSTPQSCGRTSIRLRPSAVLGAPSGVGRSPLDLPAPHHSSNPRRIASATAAARSETLSLS
jgi:transposase